MSDPAGRRALFEAPAREDRDGTGAGREALFSAPPPRGTAAITCEGCGVRTRLPVGEAARRVLRFTVWLPWRHHNRWMRCPACERRTWCRVHWLG